MEVPIVLEAVYSVSLTLTGPGGSVSLAPPEQALELRVLPLMRGQRGESGATSRRHAFAAPHSYCATAPAGTLDSAAGWSITRITVAADGTTTVAHATGAWADRAALTYT